MTPVDANCITAAAKPSPRGRVAVASTGRSRRAGVKKWLTCLGCGRPMFTDPAHRRCRECKRLFKDVYDRRRFKADLPEECEEQP